MTILGITVITILSGHITMVGTDLTALRGALAGTILGGGCITHGHLAGVGAGTGGGTPGTMAITGAGAASDGAGILGIMAPAGATAGMIGMADRAQEDGMTATMGEETALMNIMAAETAEGEALELMAAMQAAIGLLEAHTEKTLQWE